MTPVVLVHGVGLDRHMWEPFEQSFGAVAPGRRVVTYDMIGLGDGPHPPGPYSLNQYAQQLADVVEADPPADVVGFSMGALVAQRFAIDRVASVRRLVLVSGVFDRSSEQRAAVAARVAEVRAGGYAASIEPALTRWFTPSFAAEHPEVVEDVRRRMQGNEVEPYADAYEVFATGDEELTPLVHRITAPTLVVTGECDERSTPEMASRLASALPHGRCVIMPGLRHLVPLEAPDALAALLSDFLDQPEGLHV